MKQLKSILGALAPTLGAAIGGPLGGQAGSILSSVLGVPNNQVYRISDEQHHLWNR